MCDDTAISNEDAIAASVAGAQAEGVPSAEALVRQYLRGVGTTEDDWSDYEDALCVNIAAFAAQAVAAERERCALIAEVKQLTGTPEVGLELLVEQIGAETFAHVVCQVTGQSIATAIRALNT